MVRHGGMTEVFDAIRALAAFLRGRAGSPVRSATHLLRATHPGSHAHRGISGVTRSTRSLPHRTT
nr:hypothetical protein GCM10010200_034450 [Actinomadura rugatobispora]